MIVDTRGAPLPRTAFCYNCGSAHGVPFWWKSRVPRGGEQTPACRWWFVSSDRRAYSSLCRECGLSLDVDAALEEFRAQVRCAVAEYRRRGGVIQPGFEDLVPPYMVPTPAATWPPHPRLGLVEAQAPLDEHARGGVPSPKRGVGGSCRTRRHKRGRLAPVVAEQQLDDASDSVSSVASQAAKGRDKVPSISGVKGSGRGEGDIKPPGRAFDPRAIMSKGHKQQPQQAVRSYAAVGGA